MKERLHEPSSGIIIPPTNRRAAYLVGTSRSVGRGWPTRPLPTRCEFILDMKAPGVTIQPLVNMAEAHSLNEVFLDDVRIPKTRLVGKKDKGFDQIME